MYRQELRDITQSAEWPDMDIPRAATIRIRRTQCCFQNTQSSSALYVEEDEKIGYRNCRSKTRAARWTECEWPSLPHEEEEARVRKELDETIHYAKLLAEAINMSPAELVRMIQE